MGRVRHEGVEPVLLDGAWRESGGTEDFQAYAPQRAEPGTKRFPISPWSDCDAALQAAVRAFEVLRTLPGARIADFLDRCAREIEHRQEALVAMAHAETALPIRPRLQEVELPRTVEQLRQAAVAARTEQWREPIIDTAHGLRSCLGPLGPVCVFGPNNFPFAFNSLAGGDFAAAMAAGNPVLGKANSSHPGTTQLLAEAVQTAAQATQLPPGTVQLIYRTRHEDGKRLVADPRLAATAYTGSRPAGLQLKCAAEAAGNLIYLELSSCNPVFILPGALRERSGEIAEQFAGSCLLGTGQFCTNPGLVLLLEGDQTEAFIEDVTRRFQQAPHGTLLSQGVQTSLLDAMRRLREAGAQRLSGGEAWPEGGYAVRNSLLRISASQFLSAPETFQTEMFGNASLLVVAQSLAECVSLANGLEGNLTGSIYSHTGGDDDDLYAPLASALRPRVGRLLNDKMPTGVAVSPAMHHGGPYPATGHPYFTAVGLPTAIARFTRRQCYDNVRPARLPPCLQDKNPHPDLWRSIDGQWTHADIP